MLSVDFQQSSSSGLWQNNPLDGSKNERYSWMSQHVPVPALVSQSRAYVTGVLGHSRRDCFLLLLPAIGAGLQLCTSSRQDDRLFVVHSHLSCSVNAGG